MKKLFITMIAAFLAVMLAAPVYAADNLELGGNYFARAWSVDNQDNEKDNDEDWFHQRFRMQGTINVADDVSAVIRADFAESVWGKDFDGGPSVPRPTKGEDGTDMHIDRTYMNINKEMWNLTVGQQYAGLGILEVMDANITGVNFGLNLDPVAVSLIYGKLDEHGNTNDDTMDDTDLYAANVGFQMAQFDSNVFFAMINDDLSRSEATKLNNDTDTLGELPWGVDLELLDETNDVTKYQNEPWALGFHTQGTVGMANLVGEIAIFGGDYKDYDTNDTIDYTGAQMYLKADADVTDMVNVGGELFYAQGTDDDDEAQISNLTDWAAFTPTVSNTPLDTWDTATQTYSAFQPFQDSDENALNTGSMGLSVFADVTPMEKLSIGTKLMYLESEEDGYADGDMLSYNAYAAYDIATNTTLSLTYLYSDIDLEVDDVDQDLEEEQTVMAEISLAF